MPAAEIPARLDPVATIKQAGISRRIRVMERAAKHISENLGIPLADLRSKMTGPPSESLGQAIQELKGLSPAAANAEAKKAEQQAKNEGKRK
ncbi:MAG: hypothetical protein DMG17_29155 [Acidobacteria bacterium]|nr:MAG: hypothetical protein DMG17_29155 [Acidobacteriota bacterium]